MTDIEDAPRANRSAEELEMRTALIPWGRARWPGARVMEELDCGGSRVDLAFVQENHIAVVEIKSSRDTLDRLERQIKHFTRSFPEVWLAVAPKWIEPLHYTGDEVDRKFPFDVGMVVVTDGAVNETISCRHWAMPHSARPDELLITPLLHLLHVFELKNVAAANGLAYRERWPSRKLIYLIAHKMTGEQIKAGVCRELRARQRGWPGDEPLKVMDGSKANIGAAEANVAA